MVLWRIPGAAGRGGEGVRGTGEEEEAGGMGGHRGGEEGEEEKASEKVGDGSLAGERRSAGPTPTSRASGPGPGDRRPGAGGGGPAGRVKRGSTAPGAGCGNSWTRGTGTSRTSLRRERSALTVSGRRRWPKWR